MRVIAPCALHCDVALYRAFIFPLSLSLSRKGRGDFLISFFGILLYPGFSDMVKRQPFVLLGDIDE